MPETKAPYVRINRVTTRRSLRPLNCPLEPELIVAEFAGELPPDVAVAVREHIAVCETCHQRALTLRAPYDLLSSLGSEPVPYVPDLRDPVRSRVQTTRRIYGPLRMLAALGRGGAIAVVAVALLIGIAVLLLNGTLPLLGAQGASRSTNQLTNVPAAAHSGSLVAETDKLVPVKDSSGKTWYTAEIIVVGEQNGVVHNSLPASSASLQVARSGQLPVSVQVSNGIVAELTAPDGSGAQALVTFTLPGGYVLAVTPLKLANGASLPSGVTGDALTLSPDGNIAYVGLSAGLSATSAGPRVIAFSTHTGALLRSLTPSFLTTIPMPPPPGSLPASAFPASIPKLDASGVRPTLGLHGALAISPDGRWLFDVWLLTMRDGARYMVVRRFDALVGGTAQELAIAGYAKAIRLVANQNAQQPAIYLVTGSPDVECYVLDAGATGPTLLGDVPLGGPVGPPSLSFDETLSVGASANGAQVYVTQDATSSDGQIVGHDLWLVDAQGYSLVSTRTERDAAGMALPNNVADAHAQSFLLRSGVINIIAPDLTGTPTPWLSLGGGRSVVNLITTLP